MSSNQQGEQTADCKIDIFGVSGSAKSLIVTLQSGRFAVEKYGKGEYSKSRRLKFLDEIVDSIARPRRYRQLPFAGQLKSKSRISSAWEDDARRLGPDNIDWQKVIELANDPYERDLLENDIKNLLQLQGRSLPPKTVPEAFNRFIGDIKYVYRDRGETQLVGSGLCASLDPMALISSTG